MSMNLSGHGFTRQQIRQGGGRGTGNDHVEDLYGCTELFVYQTPNKKVTGFESLKMFIESEECEVIFTADAPPELNGYETMRITQRQGQAIPPAVVKRCHSWAHQRNFLHSFFKPMYR